MPTNAFRERMENYLKAVEQTANDSFQSSLDKKKNKDKLAKNSAVQQQERKSEPPKENSVVRNRKLKQFVVFQISKSWLERVPWKAGSVSFQSSSRQ
jgi:hypothetical protein